MHGLRNHPLVKAVDITRDTRGFLTLTAYLAGGAHVSLSTYVLTASELAEELYEAINETEGGV